MKLYEAATLIILATAIFSIIAAVNGVFIGNPDSPQAELIDTLSEDVLIAS